MRKIFLLFILVFFRKVGYSQKYDTISNPLEKIIQNNFDTTILFSSYSNWDLKPNYLIISKKDSLVYFYRYSINHRSSLGRMTSPPKSEIFSKLISNEIEYGKTIPDVNVYFSWVDTKLSNESIWKDITKYNLCNLIDYSKTKTSFYNCGTTDGCNDVFKLITKSEIIKLEYYDPLGMNECEFNQTREIVIKIEKVILDYFKNK